MTPHALPVGLHDADRVRRALAGHSGTDPGDWHLVSKPQHALLVVLRAIARHAGPGEVVTQPLTSVTTVAPVVTAGLRPRYGDLDPDSLALDPVTVPPVTSATTRAVIAQHTFGPAAPLARLREFTPEGALLVEDSSHCVAHLGRNGSGQPVADVSVHGFGPQLSLPARSGAAVWVNPELDDGPWRRVLTSALTSLPVPGRREAFAGAIGAGAGRVVARFGTPAARAVTAAASVGLVDLEVMPSELSGRVAGEPARLTGPALEEAADLMLGLGRAEQHRRRIATVYRVGLAGLAGVDVPRLLDDPGRTLVRYPLLLESAERSDTVLAALRDDDLAPGRWYRTTLSPGPTDPAAFFYEPSMSPVAERTAPRGLNLRTDPSVTPEEAQRAVEVIRAHL